MDLSNERTSMETRTDDENSPAEMTTELARRVDSGIEVLLLWDKPDSWLRVVVDDLRTGGSFELVARDGKEGLDAFHHPFAYAAARNIASGSKVRPVRETLVRERESRASSPN
jgi:hypothetical protein